MWHNHAIVRPRLGENRIIILCATCRSHSFHPRFSFFHFLRTETTSTRSKSLEKNKTEKTAERSSPEKLAQFNTWQHPSSASRLDGELLQVFVIGDVGGDGIADDIGGLFAISLLPLGVELLVGLGDFLLRCY